MKLGATTSSSCCIAAGAPAGRLIVGKRTTPAHSEASSGTDTDADPSATGSKAAAVERWRAKISTPCVKAAPAAAPAAAASAGWSAIQSRSRRFDFWALKASVGAENRTLLASESTNARKLYAGPSWMKIAQQDGKLPNGTLIPALANDNTTQPGVGA